MVNGYQSFEEHCISLEANRFANRSIGSLTNYHIILFVLINHMRYLGINIFTVQY